ncbi:MAG TPA: phospholipid carrier-dependent glycosyltransferase, partial [Anaerolineales bacterium]
MTLRKLTFEHLLFFIALILAWSVRLINLGAAPLSDAESNWALQALQASGRGSNAVTVAGQTAPAVPEAPAWGPQPGYVVMTGAAFKLFGASNALARLWPALIGALLALIPLFLRRELGRAAALILAFGLAIDPGLVAVSRQAGSSMPALVFVLLALTLWRARLPVLAGIFTGLALLSGPSILLGGLGLGLARVLTLVFNSEQPAEPSISQRSQAARNALLSAGAVVLLAGTLFFTRPQGLAAWTETLPAFIRGWFQSSGVLALSLPAALLFYQPLALIFGLLGAAWGLLRPGRVLEEAGFSPSASRATYIYLLIWALAALVLGLVYPGRESHDGRGMTPGVGIWRCVKCGAGFFPQRLLCARCHG